MKVGKTFLVSELNVRIHCLSGIKTIRLYAHSNKFTYCLMVSLRRTLFFCFAPPDAIDVAVVAPADVSLFESIRLKTCSHRQPHVSNLYTTTKQQAQAKSSYNSNNNSK